MKQSAIALYKFASSFGWDAYPEYAVPKNAKLPYITYTLQEYNWDETGMAQIRLWYKGTDYNTINDKIDEIKDVTKTGAIIPTESGNLFIFPGSPWCQFQASDEEDLKIAYINLDVHYATK